MKVLSKHTMNDGSFDYGFRENETYTGIKLKEYGEYYKIMNDVGVGFIFDKKHLDENFSVVGG